MPRYSLTWLAAISCMTACGGVDARAASDAWQQEPARPSPTAAATKPATPQPTAAGSKPPVAEPVAADADADADADAADPPSYTISRGRSVQWKRNAAFEADLMRGLDLTQDEVCQELGSQSCIRAVHTVALGGNDPFGSGLLRPAQSSLSTTPLAVDRVTLSACSQRARADKQGDAKVFKALDFSGAAPAAGSDASTSTITTLFRRLLARDPKPGEISTLEGLLTGDSDMDAEAFATLSCFIVASSIESLFF